MDHAGLELVPSWDTGTAGGGLTCDSMGSLSSNLRDLRSVFTYSIKDLWELSLKNVLFRLS